jgi:copper chaperone CopZ
MRGIAMNAVHTRTDGMHCDACPPRIEADIEHVPGVKAARAYRSMHLTSVLYDPELVDAETIRDHIMSAGFDARVLAGGHLH